jgi:hypothetical protein
MLGVGKMDHQNQKVRIRTFWWDESLCVESVVFNCPHTLFDELPCLGPPAPSLDFPETKHGDLHKGPGHQNQLAGQPEDGLKGCGESPKGFAKNLGVGVGSWLA